MMPFRPSWEEVADWQSRLERMDLPALLAAARWVRQEAWGDLVTYSPKVFIPLTRLCRDVCSYCTFAHSPKPGQRAFMTVGEVLAVARAGQAAGCVEALFTLGELPEQRYRVAADELTSLGHPSTPSYVAEAAAAVLRETGLLPHVNAGILSDAEMVHLRAVSASQGLMLEGTAAHLMQRGGAHFGSKGKAAEIRIDHLDRAGRLAVPSTSGILVGLGENRAERIDALLTLNALHRAHGHLQEVIVQNFQPKPGTRMAGTEPLEMEEFLWTIAAARLILDPSISLQAPPNLSHARFGELLTAGINDWGGVSPVTPDHVNPEAPWPEIEALRQATLRPGLRLAPRLPIYPAYLAEPDRWLAREMIAPALQQADASGLARGDHWHVGAQRSALPKTPAVLPGIAVSARIDGLITRTERGERLAEPEIATLFAARDVDMAELTARADALRRKVCGDTVSYAVVRNINYTNICAYKCSFCAFSKGKLAETLRGKPYDISLEEVSRRAAEAWDRGATEVCMQGGIHPKYTGQTYLDLLAAAKAGAPGLHIHAFSPLEVRHGADTLGLSLRAYLDRLVEAGLGSLPGTAAEILSDDMRTILCPDKLGTEGWLEVVRTAHQAGLRTTSTIMFGHVETPTHWARHLLALRDLQAQTGGITEFVPLPFVHMEAPIYLKGRARKGPTFREAILMHSVSRLVLYPLITNIQASWVKLGPGGVAAALAAGVNDLGGTLMNESISRAAGAEWGQEMPPSEMERMIRLAGRVPRQRTTVYGDPPQRQTRRSFQAPELTEMVLELTARGC